jgi:Flp pilus assembly pilin Flp
MVSCDTLLCQEIDAHGERASRNGLGTTHVMRLLADNRTAHDGAVAELRQPNRGIATRTLRMKEMIERIRRDQQGASTAEYVLMLALVAVACIGGIANTGIIVRSKLNVDVAGALNVPNFVPTASQPAPGTSGNDGDDPVINDGGQVIHNPHTPGAGKEKKP